MACPGASELAEYDFEGRNGAEALSTLSRILAGRGEIDDSFLPPSILGADDLEQKKAGFLKTLRESLALSALVKGQPNDDMGGGVGGGGGGGRHRRAGNGTKLKSTTVSQFFNRLLALKVAEQHLVFDCFEVRSFPNSSLFSFSLFPIGALAASL